MDRTAPAGQACQSRPKCSCGADPGEFLGTSPSRCADMVLLDGLVSRQMRLSLHESGLGRLGGDGQPCPAQPRLSLTRTGHSGSAAVGRYSNHAVHPVTRAVSQMVSDKAQPAGRVRVVTAVSRWPALGFLPRLRSSHDPARQVGDPYPAEQTGRRAERPGRFS